MSLILSGTDGLSDVDGSAATPAIRGTDANTGIFFPAADTIAFSEGGVESMRIDSAGNVGIGTASPNANSKLDVAGISQTSSASYASFQLYNSGLASNPYFRIAYDSANNLVFNNVNTAYNSSSEFMRINSAGNVGIGTSSLAGYRVSVKQSGNTSLASIGIASINSANDTYIGMGYNATSDTCRLLATYDTNGAFKPLTFLTSDAERMRIDSSGNLLVGRTGTDPALATGVQIAGGNTGFIQQGIDTATNSNHFVLYNRNATNTGYRFYVNANGGIYNFSANNVNLSDERTKTDIQNAGNYLAKICAIPVRTFKYKDQSDDLLSLGVIAQEVEVIAPELVNVDGFGETPDDGVPLKAIYQTDLQYALMKCIQEQQALIQSLTTRITALETK